MSSFAELVVKGIRRPSLILPYLRAQMHRMLYARYAKPMSQQITRDGELYHTPLIMHPTDRLNLRSGKHENDERKLLQAFESSDVIIEIGANFGYMARHAFAKLNPGGLYVAVEPNPEVQGALAKNMAETARRYPTCGFEIVASAVCGQGNGHVDFAVRPNLSSGLANHLVLESGEKIVRVPARTLSSLTREYVAQGKSVSLICDAEGAEIAMVHQDAGAFAAFKNVAIELHERELTGSDVDPAAMRQAFRSLGFDLLKQDQRGTCCLFRRRAAAPTMAVA